MGLEAQYQIAHTFPGGQLTKNHTEHLVPTSKGPDVLIAFVFIYDAVEYPAREELGDLRKNIFTLVHRVFYKNPIYDSNRHAIKNAASTIYKDFKELKLI
jgi:hypothetical protein